MNNDEENIKKDDTLSTPSYLADDEDSSHICKVGNNDKPESAVSKRPWKCSAKEVQFMTEDGETRSCWMRSIVDANGDTVCFGRTADIDFIIEMENFFDNALKMLENSRDNIDSVVESIKKFGK